MTQTVLPAITVIMTSYNTERYIAAAISSILQQTFDDFELLIYDDGSTDASIEIIKSYQLQDKRIVLLGEGAENQGFAYARQQLINYARGKYIAIVDSDDISFNNRLSVQFNYMERHPHITVLGGGMYSMYGEKRIVKVRLQDLYFSNQQIRAGLLVNNFLQDPTIMIRRDVFHATGIQYDERFRYGADYILWVDFILQSKYTVVFKNLRKPLVYYRIHETSLTALFNREQASNKQVFLHATGIILDALGIPSTEENKRKYVLLIKRRRFPEYISDGTVGNRQDWESILEFGNTIIEANNKLQIVDPSIFSSVLYTSSFMAVSFREPYFWYLFSRLPKRIFLKAGIRKFIGKARYIFHAFHGYTNIREAKPRKAK